jgi:hypothetical protein
MGRGTIRAFIVVCFLTASAHAAPPFIRVADTTTAAPGGTGTFTSFDPPSSNREALPFDPIEISFRGVTSTGVKGVYSGFSGFTSPPVVQLGRLVDSTMPMPGFAENYGDFTSVSGGSGNVFWTAVGAGGTNMGVYWSQQLGGAVIAKSGDMRDDLTLTSFGPVSFGNFDDPFRVVYQGNFRNVPAIFNADGSTIDFGASPSIARLPGSGTAIAYRNSTSTVVSECVVPAGGTAVRRTVANLNTSIPVGSGRFTGFGDATATLSYVLFRGMSSDQQGIYRSTTSGTLSRVADLTTLAPGAGGAHFTSFSDLSPGDEFSEYDAFVATLSDGREGIYLAQGSKLAKLIDTSDLLDGRTIDHLFLSRDAIEWYNIGFKAAFKDGSQGIYAAVTVFPEPGVAITMLPALMWLGLARRAKTK